MRRLDEILKIHSDTDHCYQYSDDCPSCVSGKALLEMHDRLREAEKIIYFHTCGPKVGVGNQCNECDWLASLEGE